jgi:nitrate/nitrite transport system ATP-binding protein
MFVQIDHVDKVFPLANGGRYVALKNIELEIKQGEFVSLIGHSGCGKSTLLNMIAGLDRATAGGVILEGREITEPGPDRMVVFQNYSLLPWLSVRENIALAVDEVYSRQPKSERKSIIEHHIELVGLQNSATKRPGELSGGMKQRVAIARALAIIIIRRTLRCIGCPDAGRIARTIDAHLRREPRYRRDGDTRRR